jgi:hypothetical protein
VLTYSLPPPSSLDNYSSVGCDTTSDDYTYKCDRKGSFANISIQSFTPSQNTAGLPPTFTNWLALHSYTAVTLSAEQQPDNDLAYFDTIMFRNCSIKYSPLVYPYLLCEPFGARCSIFPCLKTYRAEVKNFVLNEVEISRQKIEFVRPKDGPSVNGYFKLSERSLRHGQWFNCSNSTHATAEHNVPVLINYTMSADYEQYESYTYVQQECFWLYGSGSALGLGDYLSMYDEVLPELSLYPQSPSQVVGHPWLQTLFNKGNASMETIQPLIDGLANAITGVIRQLGGQAQSSEASNPVGTAWRTETCITVQWAWLSLPASLLLFAIVFLSLTIWKMENSQVNLWKSSPLALLFHGIGHGLKEQHGTLEEVREMKVAARSISARVDQLSGTWHLTTETVSNLAP